MNQEETWKPSMGLILLDLVGTVLLGLGLAERFAATNLVPASLQFEHYDLVMMIVGVALMAPLLLSLVGFAKRNARTTST